MPSLFVVMCSYAVGNLCSSLGLMQYFLCSDIRSYARLCGYFRMRVYVTFSLFISMQCYANVCGLCRMRVYVTISLFICMQCYAFAMLMCNMLLYVTRS